MTDQHAPMSRQRRLFLQRLGLSAAAFATPSLFTVRGAFAEELLETPRLTEGPFYPNKLPLDTDNDLLIVNDSITPAVGEITHLTGKVMDVKGAPLRNAFVEIWQVDNTGSYINTNDSHYPGRDTNFQGYGRFLTDSQGAYYFRTIKPVPYTGRTPHIHLAVSRNGRRILTTQFLINGHPQNAADGVFRGVRDALARETILIDFKPLAGSKIGELTANFDVVLGVTPDERDDGKLRGGIGKPEVGGRRG